MMLWVRNAAFIAVQPIVWQTETAHPAVSAGL